MYAYATNLHTLNFVLDHTNLFELIVTSSIHELSTVLVKARCAHSCILMNDGMGLIGLSSHIETERVTHTHNTWVTHTVVITSCWFAHLH